MSTEWDDDEPAIDLEPPVVQRRPPPPPDVPDGRDPRLTQNVRAALDRMGYGKSQKSRGRESPQPSEGSMEEIAGKGMDFVRGVGRDHGPVVALLFVTLTMVFVLLFMVVYFIGMPIKSEIENNVASTKAMMAVVDQMEDQCRAPRVQWPPQQQWPQQQPRQWPQIPSQQPGFQNGSQQTPR